jgi:MFS family permease
VMIGILALNNFGHLVARRRLIEGGLIVMGILIAILSLVGTIVGLVDRVDAQTSLGLSRIVSALTIVVLVALVAGMAYAAVAISSQTQLQEDLPEDVRGRVYGVLFTLISVASFVPVIIVGPIADIAGTTFVLLCVAAILAGTGVLSVVTRGSQPGSASPSAERPAGHARLEPVVLTPDSSVSHPEDAIAHPPPVAPSERP